MIIYLHGFRSSSTSIKAEQLRKYLTDHPSDDQFWCEDLPISPKEAIDKVSKIIETSHKPPLIVGSSLGGYYATFLAERFDLKAVLINPACRAAELLEPWVGPHRNLYTDEKFDLTQAHIRELRALWISPLMVPKRFWVLLETGDAVLDFRVAVETYQGARITIKEGGDHGLQSFPEFIPEIVRLSKGPSRLGP
ncbi:MAG: hypothetical protein RLZ25_2047 [Pseudomonadota bacterium]|jgi:predicted esterase YcpF (UPF0227 family)